MQANSAPTAFQPSDDGVGDVQRGAERGESERSRGRMGRYDVNGEHGDGQPREHYTLAGGTTTGTGLRQAIYYAKNIAAGSNTVTVKFNQAAVFRTSGYWNTAVWTRAIRWM